LSNPKFTGLDLRRLLASATVKHAKARLVDAGHDPDEFLSDLRKLPELVLSRGDLVRTASVVREWDRTERQQYLRGGFRTPCPHCGETDRLRWLSPVAIDRDLGLHFRTEDLVENLQAAVPNIVWDMRNVTVAYRLCFRSSRCKADVLACSKCQIRYVNSRWKERAVTYQSDVVRDGKHALFGRANDPDWVRHKAASAGYACEVLGPIKGLKVLDVGAADGIMAWQLAFAGAQVTGVEVNINAANYARRIMGLNTVVTRPYTKDLFPESSFDRIVTFHVIEHVLDFDSFIAAMAAHLRPGGLVLLQCPIADDQRQAVGNSHPLGLTTGLLVRAFKRHGFTIKSVERCRADMNEARRDPDVDTNWSGIIPGVISIIAASR
jgi:2-polyprenyl-3-methyl-5-hydroxy-6-metoxy-1,4-benzoquinol methylase